MGLISSLASLMASVGTSAVSNKQPPTVQASGTQAASKADFGPAFMLSITQTTSATGSTQDDVAFESYSPSASGKGSSGSYATGSGTSLGSAFEQLLASMDPTDSATGKDASKTTSPATSAASASDNTSDSEDSLMQMLESALTTMANELQTISGGNTQTASKDSASSDAANAVSATAPRHHHHPMESMQAANATATSATQPAASDTGSSTAAVTTDAAATT